MSGHTPTLQLSIFKSLSEACTDWQQLKGVRCCTPYQSPEWLSAWHETIGNAQGIEPAIAVGRINEKPVIILPLGVKRTAGVKTVSFLGHQNGNQNTGCWDADFYKAVTPAQIQVFLDGICRDTGADVLALQNVPEFWQDRKHPLILDTATPSPSPIFTRAMTQDFDTLFKDTHSKSSRKNLLRKQKHLEAAGGYQVVKAATREDVERAFKAFLGQRAKRAAAAGIPNVFSKLKAQDFLARLLGLKTPVSRSTKKTMDIWFLETGGEIRATYLCVEQAGTIYAYSNSVAHDETLPNSPGLVLIKEIIEQACASPDLQTLDLGLGEERYKTAWAEPEPLKDSLKAVTWKGVLKERQDLLITRTKTTIRNSDLLWPMVRQLRKWKAGLGNDSKK